MSVSSSTYENRAEPLIRRLNALHPLRPHETAALVNLVQDVRTVPHDQDILVEHQRVGEATVLLDGLACHYRIMASARRQMTGVVVPGDFCDYGFLSSSPVQHNVISLGHAVIGTIELAQFSALGERHPDIIVAAMRAAAIEQARVRELVVSLGARDALKRMAYFLCELHHRMKMIGLVSEAGTFPLSMTQSDLGEALGLSTVHVNRTIQQLRRRGLITIGQGSVTIHDGQALGDVATFDGRYLEPS